MTSTFCLGLFGVIMLALSVLFRDMASTFKELLSLKSQTKLFLAVANKFYSVSETSEDVVRQVSCETSSASLWQREISMTDDSRYAQAV